MYFGICTGLIFAVFGAVISNLDRLSSFFSGLSPSLSYIFFQIILPFIIALTTIFIFTYFLEHYQKNKEKRKK
jgi:ABC-type multidrug transport system permease subunit